MSAVAVVPSAPAESSGVAGTDEMGGQPLKLAVGGTFTLGKLSEAQVLSLAAAAAPGSTDPVDEALATALHNFRPDLPLPVAEPGDIDPATPARRYSLTRLRDFRLEGKAAREIIVMRGQLAAVLAKVKTSRENRALLRHNANWAEARGWRPLAVATATVGPGGLVGDFRFQGFVSIGEGKTGEQIGNGPPNWARVSLWSASLRVQHWLNVATIFTLCCTGYYIMDPFFGPSAAGGEETGFLMGWMRLIHFTAGFVWLVIGLTRLVLAFTSRDPHLRWREFWPLKKKEDVRNLGRVVQYYALIKNEAPLYLGHNPLQQLTYSAVYIGCALQLMSGLVLFSLYHQTNPFWELVGTPIHWFGVPIIRLFHTCMMFAIWAFVVMHVYLAVRADSLERHGGISSMINGGVWVRQGAKPVDAPEVG